MADLPVPQNWDVEPTDSVRKKWLLIKIQERRSQIAATKQRIEDIKRAEIVGLEAKLEMLELSLAKLEGQRDAIIINVEER